MKDEVVVLPDAEFDDDFEPEDESFDDWLFTLASLYLEDVFDEKFS